MGLASVSMGSRLDGENIHISQWSRGGILMDAGFGRSGATALAHASTFVVILEVPVN